MTSELNDQTVTDETLVAYLDGELPPGERSSVESALESDEELRERLALLDDGARPWKDAFAGLLEQAPMEKLEADLAAAIQQQAEQAPTSGSADLPPIIKVPANDHGNRRWWRPAMAACVAVTLLVGFAAGYGTNEAQNPEVVAAVGTEAEAWRQAVADYQALYTRETLSVALTDPVVQSAGLQRVSKSLGLTLPDSVSEVGGLDYKRAQILKFGSQPLAQLAYLYKDEVPVAFCIVRLDETDRAASNEVRSGLNIVHWSKGGYSLMLVGDLPVEELNDFARELEGRV
ncbi:hypothetical protein [Pelagibius sp. Alg239-R121]|uniref:hypothetical protein n=1 Tax=Pelagibius sp. Alg239-R121 TaxID=2993448 RepID=UPI0024A7743B|nr:hypothetical protein [Pelagibius sp. Alg239-R121]